MPAWATAGNPGVATNCIKPANLGEYPRELTLQQAALGPA